MSKQSSPTRKRKPPADGLLAVIDIGSNSLRLVVFDTADRTLHPLFNEKILCGLGRGLDKTGRLNPDGVPLAQDYLLRFTRLARAMGVDRIDLIATAAIRDAEDGPDFVAEAERACGSPIRTLSGEEEGRLAALGVAAGIPDATGIVGDLGGGSLELAELRNGQPGRSVSLPLGPLRLIGRHDGKPAAMRQEIDRQLATVGWLAENARAGDGTLYAVGGAWRNLARLHMQHRRYPLHVIHGYGMSRTEIDDVERLVGHLGPRSLARIEGVSRRRAETLPAAALVLAQLVKTLRYKTVVFSAHGLREGHLFEAMPAERRAEDPLFSAAEAMAEKWARFGGMSDGLAAWTAPLFEDETPIQRRLRLASCKLADIAWRDHADYRARQAFQRILYFPFAGIGHGDRVFLALAGFARYGGAEKAGAVAPFLGLLPRDAAARARQLGLAQRLAYQVSGASADVLRRSDLTLDAKGRLTLRLRDVGVPSGRGAVERRLQALGAALGAADTAIEESKAAKA